MIKNIAILGLFVSTLYGNIFGQESKIAINKNFDKAEIAFEKIDYLNAFKLYNKVLKEDGSNYHALFKAGLCLFNINKSDTNCLPYFEKSRKAIPEAYFYLGRYYLLHDDKKKAIEEFYYFSSINNGETIEKSEVDNWIKITETAMLRELNKGNYTVKNIGNSINSQYPEYVPLLFNDEKNLFFTSRRPNGKDTLKDPYGNYFEDIFMAEKENDSTWSKPQPINELNSLMHDACVSISPNGTEMFIYRNDEAHLEGEIYLCKYKEGKWQEPERRCKMDNTGYLEPSACYTPDESVIIFSSNRPGGYGGKDLYQTTRFANGKYSLPKNLGHAINTTEDEDAPFVAPNYALYFSSKGHNTMGEYDIYRSTYNDKSGTWELPENMGIPINSSSDDIYFVTATHGQKAYFSSNRPGGYGNMDIYEVGLNESASLIIRGKIIADSAIINSKITISLYNSENENLEGIYNLYDKVNSFIFVVKDQVTYKILVESDEADTELIQKKFSKETRELKISLKKKTP